MTDQRAVPSPDIPAEDTIIVGAGPIGLACALSAKRRGIDPLVIDAGAVVNSVVRYPVGMQFFTTPELLEIGGHPFPCAGQKPTREEALKYYRGIVENERIRVRTWAALHDVRRVDDRLQCTLDVRTGAKIEHVVTECRRLVLATGYYDNPTLLNVPGEDLPHVSHYFDEAHRGYNRDVVVIGGKNSAIEAALELFRAGARVTLIYRKAEFPPSVKYWIRPDIENRIKAGQISARLAAEVLRFEPTAVMIRNHTGREESIPADRVYALTGFHPDFELFQKIGVTCDTVTGRPSINPDTLETNVPGIYMAGSIVAGWKTAEVFIENGRFDGEKVFGALHPDKVVVPTR